MLMGRSLAGQVGRCSQDRERRVAFCAAASRPTERLPRLLQPGLRTSGNRAGESASRRRRRRSTRKTQLFSVTTMTAFTDLPDLAAERLGGAVLIANDEFFAPKESLLRAGPPVWKEGE